MINAFLVAYAVYAVLLVILGVFVSSVLLFEGAVLLVVVFLAMIIRAEYQDRQNER